MWRRAVERYGVIILFTFAGIDFLLLWQFCVSDEWAPFYLNQTAVFGRRRPENEDLIRRLRITCPLCTDRARELRLRILGTGTPTDLRGLLPRLAGRLDGGPVAPVFGAAVKVRDVGTQPVTSKEADHEAETGCTDGKRDFRICHAEP